MRKILLLLSFFFFATPITFAADAYSTVYRVDDRAPEVVFASGFQPHGTNINVEMHLTGWSSGVPSANRTRDSAFISTTVNGDEAQNFMESQIQSGSNYYIYDIEPDQNFYSADETMHYIAERQQVSLAIEFEDMLTREEEYFAVGGIRGDQIRGAEWYYRNPVTQEVEFRGYYANPNFLDRQTETNTEPYTASADLPIENRPVFMAFGSNHSASMETDDESNGSWTSSTITASGSPVYYSSSSE
ncbi:hypothetical protein COMNV_01345 [Commensalibacter sp. Nvir]|uniref:scabin-related ADP-ribosyltransferase n=1 Tax=Commensalibacter sp. Nvir TaxID=3069817 RepID=UPI002D4DB9C6|nr:hypothetical protein COMNV_01345 [Commensalibacter sp. Nvir]